MEDIVQLQYKWIMSHFSVWIMKWMRNYVEISMKVRGNLKTKKHVQNFTNGSKVSNWWKIVKATFCCHSAVAKWKLENSKTEAMNFKVNTYWRASCEEKLFKCPHLEIPKRQLCSSFSYQEVLCRSCADRTQCCLIWVIYLYAGLSLVVAFILDWRLYCSVFLLVLCSCLCH